MQGDKEGGGSIEGLKPKRSARLAPASAGVSIGGETPATTHQPLSAAAAAGRGWSQNVGSPRSMQLLTKRARLGTHLIRQGLSFAGSVLAASGRARQEVQCNHNALSNPGQGCAPLRPSALSLRAAALMKCCNLGRLQGHDTEQYSAIQPAQGTVPKGTAGRRCEQAKTELLQLRVKSWSHGTTESGVPRVPTQAHFDAHCASRDLAQPHQHGPRVGRNAGQ